MKAARRGAEILTGSDLEIGVVAMPEGEDPDSYIHVQGNEAFRERVEHRMPLVDFWAALYHRAQTVRDRVAVLHELVEVIAAVADGIKRTELLKRISEKFGIGTAELKDLMTRQPGPRPPARTEVTARAHVATPHPRDEMELLRMIMTAPESQPWALRELEEVDFRDKWTAALFRLLRKVTEGVRSVGVSELIDHVQDEEAKSFIAVVATEPYRDPRKGVQPPFGLAEDTTEERIRKCIRRMQLRRTRERLTELRAQIDGKEARGEDATEENVEYARLLTRTRELSG